MTFLEPGSFSWSALLAEQEDAAPADPAAQRQACEDAERAIQARKKEALDAETRALEAWLRETAAQPAGSQVCCALSTQFPHASGCFSPPMVLACCVSAASSTCGFRLEQCLTSKASFAMVAFHSY